MTLSRRSLLAATTALIPTTLLVSCSGTTLSQLAQDAQAAVNAAQAVDNGLIAAGANIPSSVAGYLSVIGASATAIENATSGSTGSLPSQLVAAGEAVLPILATAAAAIPGIGATVSLGLSALRVLITTIASEAGLSSVSTAPANAAMAAIAPMDITTARRLYASSIVN